MEAFSADQPPGRRPATAAGAFAYGGCGYSGEGRRARDGGRPRAPRRPRRHGDDGTWVAIDSVSIAKRCSTRPTPEANQLSVMREDVHAFAGPPHPDAPGKEWRKACA